MFKRKYKATLLDSKWSVIKNNVIFEIIPRKDEYIYYIDRYYHVINVVHNIGVKHNIFIVIEELTQYVENNISENQLVKK